MCNNRGIRADPNIDSITPLLWLLGINVVSNTTIRYAMDGKMPSAKSVGVFAATNAAYLFFLKKFVENELVKYIDNPDYLQIASMSIGNTIASSGAVAIGLKSGKVNMKSVREALIDSALTAGGAEILIKFVLPMIQKKE